MIFMLGMYRIYYFSFHLHAFLNNGRQNTRKSTIQIGSVFCYRIHTQVMVSLFLLATLKARIRCIDYICCMCSTTSGVKRFVPTSKNENKNRKKCIERINAGRAAAPCKRLQSLELRVVGGRGLQFFRSKFYVFFTQF